jgi:hypothetical protein
MQASAWRKEKAMLGKRRLVIAGAAVCCAFVCCGTSPPSGTVTITSPNCKNSYSVGQTVSITWTESGLENVDEFAICVTTDNGACWHRLACVPAGVMNYDWVPTGNHVSALCRIKLAGNGGEVSDESDVVFSVSPAGTHNTTLCCSPDSAAVKVLYPNGGETFHVGDVVEIKFCWNDTHPPAPPSTLIYLTTNRGRSWSESLPGTPLNPPASTLLWTVGAADTGTECFIRVEDFVQWTRDRSDTTFTVLSQ